jgi:hypothetical protein
VAAGNVADRVGHGEDRKPEGERDANEADADLGKGGGKDGAAAASQNEPEGAEAFRGECPWHDRGSILRDAMPASGTGDGPALKLYCDHET